MAIGKCNTKSDCGEFELCVEGECEHKDIFPVYPMEFFGLIILSALVGLANVSGIGGGGITVPLVAICWGFSTKKAIALSGATIFFGQIVRFIY